MLSFLKNLFSGTPKNNLNYEAEHQVELTDESIIHTCPDGVVEKVFLNEIEKIEIMTTDEGPFVCDWFWVIHGKNENGSLIPQGATGENQLLEKFQTFPGFNSQAVIDASCSTENNRFVCYTTTAT